MSPTPRAVWLLVFAALSALLVPTPVAVVLMVAVAAASAADAWTVRSVPVVERTAPPLLSRGVPSRLTVRPERTWPGIRIRQPVTDGDLTVEPSEADAHLVSELTAHRRGRHLLPAAATRTLGPLGLGAWYHRTGTPTEIVVYPDMPAARRLAMDVRVGRFRDEGRRSRGPLGLGTEFEAIREYQPDDDIRQVNWTATARLGSPMSNTYRVEHDRDVICVLDCGRLMSSPLTVTPPDGSPYTLTRLDAAVDAVAAMAAVASEVGDRIGLVAFSDRVVRDIKPRRDAADVVLHAVHDLEPQAVDSDYEAAFRVAADMKRAFVLVLTDLLDDTAGDPLIRALPLLARRHAVAVATVRDEDVRRALVTPATTVAEAIETAVAVELGEAKDRLTVRLAHLGAEVVEAPVASLSARCISAYLRAKRRARL